MVENYCYQLIKNKNSDSLKKQNLKKIYDYLKRNIFKNNLNFTITDKHIKETFKIIDQVYFNNKITKFLKETYSKISFNASGKLTRTAGFCKWRYYLDKYGNFDYGIYEIQISKPIINNIFKDKKIKSLKINGLHCFDKLECYINLFQHEITHLLISIFCVKEGVGMGGHTKMFKDLVYNLFGHTDYKHLLLEGDSLEMEKEIAYNQLNVEIGDTIETKEIRGKIWIGEVLKLNKKYIQILLKKDGKLWNLPYAYIKKINKANKKNKNVKKSNMTPDEIKNNLKINDIVKVKLYGKIQNGIIVNLGKSRATIKFQDCKKWYIPYNMILL